MAYRSILLCVVLVLVSARLFAQESRPLSAEDLEYLLRESVVARRVTELVEKRGINFSMTSALREKLRRAGANAGLLRALDKAESNFRNRDKRETVELAKSEAKVVWYSSLQSPLPEELCSRFNSKNFGINCVVHRSGSGNLYRRWREEAKSGINQADILHTSNIDDFIRLRNEGALFRYRPEGIEKFNSSFSNASTDGSSLPTLRQEQERSAR